MDDKAHLADLLCPGFTLCGLSTAMRTLAGIATAQSGATGRIEVSLCDENGKAHTRVCQGCCDSWRRRELRTVAKLLSAPQPRSP